MRHQAVQVLVQVCFFMDLKVMEIGVFDFVFIQQRFAPAFRPVAEHFFVERARPPFDHAAFINQPAGKLRQGAAFGEDLTVDHLIDRDAERFALFDQDLDMARNTRVHQLIADLADVGREQVAMAREDALVALVNDQMKVVHFHGIAVPVAPEKLDRLQRQLARFEIAHKRAGENLFVP